MSRIRIIMLSLLAVFAVSAVASASASAAPCLKVAEVGTGQFELPTCAGAAGTKEYIKATLVGPVAGEPGVWCAEVETAGTGNYENNTCTIKVAGKNFIKVLVPEFVACAKVAAGEPSSWDSGCTEKIAGGGFAKVKFTTGTCAQVAYGAEPSAWKNAACTEAEVGTGKFIKIEALKRKFTSTSEPSYLFANAAGSFKIRCAKDKDKGEITAANTIGAVTVTFEECEGVSASEASCPVKSVGAGAGVIVTKELSGGLGVVAEAEAPSSERGLDLKPTTGTSFVLLVGEPATCIAETNVTGSVIGEVEPVKIMDKSAEAIFGVKGGKGKHNKQTIQKFVGEAKNTLTAFGVEAGFESEDSIFFEQSWEVT